MEEPIKKATPRDLSLVRATPVLPIPELDEPISHWRRSPAETTEKGEELPSCPMNSLRYFIFFERQKTAYIGSSIELITYNVLFRTW